jgi:hypothetical protein
MKKFKRQNTAKAALFAGATALMALTPNIHAQTSMETLLNKLEQKGILTVDEARELKAENETNSVDDFNTALSSKFPMPDWVTSYKLSGDFRGRFDDQTSGDWAFVERERLRYRLRAGLTVEMKDNLEAGFRIGSGDNSQGSPSNPLSNNQTLAGNASKKPLYIDTAYGKWTPINGDTWMAAITFGKMVQPFDVSPMVFDPDYTPEGGALQASYKLNSQQSFRFNGAGFVLDDIASSTSDPFLCGAQLFWDAKWFTAISTTLGVSAYDIINQASLLPQSTTTYDKNLGNTRTFAGNLVYFYNPVVLDASVTYTLDSFPLYAGAFPIKLAGEYMNNPAASINNEGWWGGVTLGKSGKKGAWDISYRYQKLDSDAWWDQVVDDDNIATVPTSLTTAVVTGGTNIKGHLVKFNYSLTDALTFTFTCYVNDLINNPFPLVKTDALHVMADMMWKF